MQLVLIPAGEFLMGSPQDETRATFGNSREHVARISRPFYLGVTEVTQEQYERVTGQNPSYRKGDPQRPVEMVRWEDALAFCGKLSEKEGRTYRLPKETEWEYACRAGSVTKWPFGDDPAALKEYAWYADNTGRTTHPVAQKTPNAWGLYDMLGNVEEWCQVWWGDEYYAQLVGRPSADPAGPYRKTHRVLRGGSYRHGSIACWPADRHWEEPGYHMHTAGFRLALGEPSEWGP